MESFSLRLKIQRKDFAKLVRKIIAKNVKSNFMGKFPVKNMSKNRFGSGSKTKMFKNAANVTC